MSIVWFLFCWVLISLIVNLKNVSGIPVSGSISDTSRNSRFPVIDFNKKRNKKHNILLFVAITSSPGLSVLRDAVRTTWLLPCIASDLCDYRFFIDQSHYNASYELVEEKKSYSDIVFRDNCKLMERHPYFINYGNAPPRKESLKVTVNNTEIDSPDYLWRRFYKIDWKVCFMKYALEHKFVADYYAFVEDDSYMCTENLLHQSALLKKKAEASTSTGTTPVSFRTGTFMFDGFDDSSTFMTKDVAVAFAHHYGEHGLNCSNILDHLDPLALNASADSMWLSWGNSWRKTSCNWVGELNAHLYLKVLRPSMDCFAATIFNVSKHITELKYGCLDRAIIMHHGTAAAVILQEEQNVKDFAPNPEHIKHTCEYMLMIDKVKEPHHMFDLWSRASQEHQFHDFSEVFLYEGDEGWLRTLKQLALEEEECKKKKAEAVSDTSKVGEGSAGALGTDCLFEQKRKLLATNKAVRHYLYGDREGEMEEDALLQHVSFESRPNKGNNDAAVFAARVGITDYYDQFMREHKMIDTQNQSEKL
jgi:hypothetical protein